MLHRVLFKSAEQLEAVSAVREYENLQREDHTASSLGLLQTTVFEAGRLCAPQVTCTTPATTWLGQTSSSACTPAAVQRNACDRSAIGQSCNWHVHRVQLHTLGGATYAHFAEPNLLRIKFCCCQKASAPEEAGAAAAQ